MVRSSNLVAFVMMVAVAASSLAVPHLGMAAGFNERPAGCHGHGGKIPGSAPTSHQCCQAGHSAAIVQPSHSVGVLPLASLTYLFDDSSRPAPASDLAKDSTTSAASPPGARPLRI